MTRTGRPLTIPEPWRTLASRAGGAAKLAAELGISRRQLLRWCKGERAPSEFVQTAVARYAARHGVRGLWA